MIEVDDRTKAVFGVMWVADQAHRCVAKAFKPFGLTPVKLNYLTVIQEIGRSEGISQQEIARRLLIDAGNVTHVLDDLEKKGWVVRDAGPDRRSNRIKITDQGSRVLDDAWPVHKEAIRQLTGGIPEMRWHELAETLKEWRGALEG